MGTDEVGLTAGVIEVNGIENLGKVGSQAIKGNIVFFNKPMDPSLLDTFRAYGITEFSPGGGGVDIAPLKKFGTPLISFKPDPQSYFDYHHSLNDTFEQVNIRELQMGSAAIASLLYLMDKFDL